MTVEHPVVDVLEWNSSLVYLGDAEIEPSPTSQLLPVNLCLNCFRRGRCLAPHENDHPYTIVVSVILFLLQHCLVRFNINLLVIELFTQLIC